MIGFLNFLTELYMNILFIIVITIIMNIVEVCSRCLIQRFIFLRAIFVHAQYIKVQHNTYRTTI